MDTNQVLINYVQTELAKGRKSEIKPDDDLLSEGILDSLGILQLVSFLEETFDIEVDDEDVVLENFMTISAINDFIQSKK
ncbi:MAG: acyl carrier protein [Anaerolineaceae bacterium]|jgi:acyl carrier protein|nr:acyl carrier protein [Anaerolineaceae bacterium]